MTVRRFFSSLLSCCALLLFLAPAATAQDKLVVAIDQSYAPFTLVTPKGTPAGLFVDLWKLWSAETGTEVEFVAGTWEESVAMVDSGKADVHSGMFKNEERSKRFSFSNAIYSIQSGLYVRTGSGPLSFKTLRGRAVGVVSGTHQHDYLERHHPEALVRTFEDHEQLLGALMGEEVDAIYDEVPTISRGLSLLGWQGLVERVAGSEFPNTVHAAVRKDRVDLVKAVDQGFARLSPTALAIIDARWTPVAEDRFYRTAIQETNIELTDAEQAFLKEHSSISLTSTPNWPPFEMEMEDGSYSGIAADFLRLAADKVGLGIKPVFDTDWGAHMDKLKSGELDVAPGLNETPKRLESFTFTEPYIEYYSAIFTRGDREDITSPDDLAGKTVALEEGYAIARNLPTDRPDIKMNLVKTTQEALEAVSSGKADAYIGNQVVASYLIKKFTLPNLKLASLWRTDLPGRLRFAVHKERPVLRDILQKGLDAITKEERETILSTYLDASGFKQKIFSLTQEQWDWLKAHPKLSLGVDPEGAPFEFLDDNGEYQGISAEYIAFIREKLKVEMAPLRGLSWGDILEYAKLGRLDIITGIVPTPEREEFLLFTDPYLEFPIVVYAANDAPLISALPDVAGSRVATVKGFGINDYLAQDYPDIVPVQYPGIKEALNALNGGEVDWFINDLATGSYAIQQEGIAGLKVAVATEYNVSLSMAVRKDLPELRDILNKALGVISDEQAAEFKNKWLALKFEHGLDMATVLSWVLPVAGGVLLIIGLVVLWNRKLGGEIAERKKAQDELAKTMETLDGQNRMLEGLSSKLAKYLSPQVYDSIFSGDRDAALNTERKKLTVFFSDIKDFTKTTDDMQPEDLTDLLNRYFTEMSAIALEYGATIDKFIGDAMLMFFGDPETKGVREDAELCVRMALAMQKRMAELEGEWRSLGYDKPFKMRIGINTGYCNVGNFGSETRMDYTIIGGEVNLAARLEGQADPGGVLISAETYGLVRDIVAAEAREPLSVKGIRRSIQPWAVLSLAGEAGGEAREAVIRHQARGLELTVDVNMLTPQEREQISETLARVASELKGDD